MTGSSESAAGFEAEMLLVFMAPIVK